MKNHILIRNIVVWVITITILFSCSETVPIQNIIISKDDLPTVSITNLKANYTEEGKMKGKLQAELMQKFDVIVEPYYDFPNGISILLFTSEGIIETSLSANSAIYYESKRTWEATGNVVISNVNGDILQTDKLYGDEKEKKIFTDQFVKITKSDGTVTRAEKGFESNTTFTIYQFVDVSGRITFQEEFANGAGDSIPAE